MENPRLVVYQKVYYVYYTTRDGLFVATSTDLINWTNHGTALVRKIYNGAVLMNPVNQAVKLDSHFFLYSSTASSYYHTYELHFLMIFSYAFFFFIIYYI